MNDTNSSSDHVPDPALPTPTGAVESRAVVSTAPPSPGASSVPPSPEKLSSVGRGDPPAPSGPVHVGGLPGWAWAGAAVLTALAAVTTWMSWETRQQVRTLEQELVKRQQGSTEQSSEAKVLAKQAQDSARESAAKVSLLEERLAEVGLQRGQLEDLIQSLSRSRDENLVTDIDSAIRVAMQQSALTGGAEPLAAALRTADERLSRVNQPRLERLRRALSHDLEKVRSVSVADLGMLTSKLDEAARLVDELPLVSVASPEQGTSAPKASVLRPAAARTPGKVASAADAASAPDWWSGALTQWQVPLAAVWKELSSLVRVTRIDRPEAMLVAPDQAYFVRENLKLRLMNARVSLMSRQYEVAEADIQAAQMAIQRYFDLQSRRTQTALELLGQVAAQGKQVVIPRPDETLAVIATLTASR